MRVWGETGIVSALCCTGASARREGKSHFFHLGCLRRFLADDLAAGTCPACSGVCCAAAAAHRCKTSTRCDTGGPPKAQRQAELEVLEGLVSMGSRTPRSAKRPPPRARSAPTSAPLPAPRPTARQVLPPSPPPPVLAPAAAAAAVREPEVALAPYAMAMDGTVDLLHIYCEPDAPPFFNLPRSSDVGYDVAELMGAMTSHAGRGEHLLL